jgi:hypothetical protein
MRYRVPLDADGQPARVYNLVAIDPGGARSGVALFCIDLDAPADAPIGRLFGGWHVSVAGVAGMFGPRARRPRSVAAPVAWVVERPHLRGDSHAQRRGVDALRDTLASIRRRCRLRGDTWAAHRPHRWKGNVPKEIHHARVWPVLDAGEHLPGRALDVSSAAYQPDVADAIALGLWALSRTGRGGVVPAAGGATRAPT